MSSCAEGTEGNYAILAKTIPSTDNKVAAVTCVEVPYCSFYHDNAAADAKKYGLDLVYNGSVSLTQPDYTSACLLAQKAGASRVVFGGDSTAMSRFMTSCSSVNYKPVLVGPGSAFTPQSPTTPELNGAWTASGVKIAPASDPAVAVALQVLRKYAPGLPFGPNGGIGWVAAKVFAQAVSNVSGNPTSQDVLNGLWSMTGYTADNLTRPLTYKRDGLYSADPRCWYPVHIENKQWVGSPKLCA
jgi:ABC-type branched-subunit amino acid transport system substrate-binding protein